MRSEAHDFLRWVIEVAGDATVGIHTREQPYGLEEFEPVGLAIEHSGDRPTRYINIFRPARGSHCRSTSFLCRVRTRNWLKLFNETYIPRKCSSTAAKR